MKMGVPSQSIIPVAQSLHLEESSEELSEPLFLKGEVQTPAYRDVNFAYLFLVQLFGVILTSAVYGPSLWKVTDIEDATTSSEQQDPDNMDPDSGSSMKFFVVVVASFLAAALTTVGLLYIMMQYSHAVVQISFLSSPLLLMVISIIFMAIDPATGGVLFLAALVFGLISALVYLCYRRYIPFAASTLRTAVSAVRVHQGLVLISAGTSVMSFCVSMIYFVCFAGIYANASLKGEVLCKDLYGDSLTDDQLIADDAMCLEHPPNSVGIFLLLLSLFWTQQVIQNVLHCTTAGTVGVWWFSGLGDPSWCSRDITESFGRATTFSFGSICFGSLLVAILQTLEHMARSARRNRNGQLLACVLECILSLMRRWLEYFNSWAFCYVGLYGYDYLTAGKNVIALFQNQGWSTFVSDRLIFRVLYASRLAVALVSGSVSALVDTATGGILSTTTDKEDGDDIDAASASHMVAFFVGFVSGLIISSCSLYVVESAVRTVIVCFAERPSDFHEHHPELCQEMREGWAAAYPEAWTNDHDLRFAEVISAPAAEAEEKKSLMT